MRRWFGFALLVVAVNFAWEMAQGGLFVGMTAMPFWTATLRCLRAALGDLAITAFAFLVAALAARDVRWPAGSRPFVSFLVFLAVGLAITAAMERWAVAVGRWKYGDRMPVILGVGLSPILQWVILPALETVIARRAFESVRE